MISFARRIITNLVATEGDCQSSSPSSGGDCVFHFSNFARIYFVLYPEPSNEVIEEIKNLFYNAQCEFKTSEKGYQIVVTSQDGYARFKNSSVLTNYNKIADLLNVSNGDDERYVYKGDCSTCEYGTEYETTLRFW